MGLLDTFKIKEVVTRPGETFAVSAGCPKALLNQSNGFGKDGLAVGASKASFPNSEQHPVSSNGGIFDINPPSIVDGVGFCGAFRADFERRFLLHVKDGLEPAQKTVISEF